jgi:branched-subunit amino acid aminotransferase/4-amino-4-deoxychorismate lyase
MTINAAITMSEALTESEAFVTSAHIGTTKVAAIEASDTIFQTTKHAPKVTKATIDEEG